MSSPSTTVAAPVAVISRRELLAARMSAYFELSKPRIASLVLVVVAVSALVGGWGAPQPWIVLHTLLGTALVAASASTFNQIIERRRDARMDRTIDRPLALRPAFGFRRAVVRNCHARNRRVRIGGLGESAHCGAGVTDLDFICRRLHAAESSHVGQHRDRRRRRSVAGLDGLERGGSLVFIRLTHRRRHARGGVVFDRLSVAVSPFHGDCLDLSPTSTPRRVCKC